MADALACEVWRRAMTRRRTTRAPRQRKERNVGFMERMRHLEKTLHEHGAAQHGLVTRAQLLTAGVPDHVIERRVRARRLRTVRRGVYQAGPIVGPRAREMAAVLACGCECRVSHCSAAGLWELRGGDSSNDSTEVTVHRRRRRRMEGIRVHRVNDLAPDEVTVLDGIPVTTPARTLLDLGECVSMREMEQAVARGERSGLVTRAELRAMVERHPRHRGARALRRILADDEPAALTRSEAEEAMLALVRKAGLPPPQVNARLFRYEVDFLWREQRLIVEVDGMAFHSSPRAIVEDRRRDAELTAAGFRVLRFTWQDITQRREATLVRLAQALAR
jgi:very-short-patch-repair endonuclease